MPEVEIRTKKSKREVMNFLRYRLPRMLKGEEPDQFGIVKSASLALIHRALTDIHADYLSKSQGNTGEDGRRWDPLSEFTIERRRTKRGRQGVKGQKNAVDTKWLAETRRRIYREIFKNLRQGGLSQKEAAKQAGNAARWATRSVWAARAAASSGLEGQGMEGPEDFLILIESGALHGSTAPGELSGSGAKVSYQESPGQVIQEGDGSVGAFSTVPYGDYHMAQGRSHITGGVRPARPWKYQDRDIPSQWMASWTEVFALALFEAIKDVINYV